MLYCSNFSPDKALAGMPNDYLKTIRLNKAAQLLKMGIWPMMCDGGLVSVLRLICPLPNALRLFDVGRVS